MITVDGVLKNLKKMIRKEFDTNEIIEAFEDFEEGGETEVIVSKTTVTSNFETHGECDGWNAYINYENSTHFVIWIDQNGKIVAVR